MIDPNLIDFRVAEKRDIFPLMELFQMSAPPGTRDSVFLDLKKLSDSIQSPSSAWIVGEAEGELVAVFSILLDRENRLGKINRLYLSRKVEDWHTLLKRALPRLVSYLESEKRQIEVIYTTARAFTLKQQEMSLDLGFHVIGVLPMAAGTDASRLNGLAAYYFPKVLTEKRYTDFSIHPIVAPFYELARRELGLAPLTIAPSGDVANINFDPMPDLELIHAPKFVARRFSRLEERRSMAMHFYPFTRPNCLITDPTEKIEIYIKIMPDAHMATIIGERLEIAVNPSDLYGKVSRMLASHGVTYIEVINDAADVWGVDCFTKAGFLPCAYFPCLKLQGDRRRDYVVLARSSERLFSDSPIPIEVNPVYLDYLTEYYKLEGHEYLSKFIPQKDRE